jgi:hypothetical protein
MEAELSRDPWPFNLNEDGSLADSSISRLMIDDFAGKPSI